MSFFWLLWKSVHPHHTRKDIVISQIISFHKNSRNKETFNEDCSVVFGVYWALFYEKNKTETVREIENPLVSTERYKPYKIQQPSYSYGLDSLPLVIDFIS